MQAFVLYRKPGYKEPELVSISPVDLRSMPSPEFPIFIFSGFHSSQRLHLFRVTDIKPESDIELLDSMLRKALPLAPEENHTSQKKFQELVNLAIKHFDSSVFHKVVLSRKASYPIQELSYVTTFYELCRRYPDAMVFLMYSPGTGSWMGATPEILLKATDKSVMSMSLAGTRLSLDPTPWGNKELKEQLIVTEYIETVFREKFEAQNIVKEGPYESTAGPVKHLRTDIYGVLPAHTHYLNLALQLHPTPAVLGSHHAKAMEFIANYEGYDRKFYTGFFGFWNFEKAEFYVNLRSMEIYHDRVELYAGAGITADSIAEDEWRETELKMQTLLSVLV